MRLPDRSNLAAQHREIFHVCMVLHGRIDSLWERLIYTHAAMVGVMVFFASQADPYTVTRVVVFVFYTVNIAFTVAAMNESYRGLQAGLEDLKALPRKDGLGHMEAWLVSLDYAAHPRRRLALVAFVWAVLGYLLFHPYVLGGGFGVPGTLPDMSLTSP